MSAYPVAPDQWPETPIVIDENPVTKRPHGDDAGYRKVRTLNDNLEPLVVPNGLETRPAYDGVDEYGKHSGFNILPGGVRDGQLVVRVTLAQTLDYAEAVLQEAFAGEYGLVALDGFRSGERQQAGWDRLRKQLLADAGKEDRDDAGVMDLYSFGIASDDTFAFVNPDADSEEYQALEKELRADAAFMQELEAAVRVHLGKEEAAELSADEVNDGIFNYVAISANSGKGRAAGRNIRLVANPMAHNSGDAVDAMLVDGKSGVLRSSVAFDHPGEISRMDFLERPDAFEVYSAAARNNPGIRAHLKAIGIEPDSFSRADFEKMQRDQRVLYHLMLALDLSFYVGETWHFNGDINPRTLSGAPLVEDSKYGDKGAVWGGNTCDTMLKLGSTGFAAFGGDTAEAVARRDWELA